MGTGAGIQESQTDAYVFSHLQHSVIRDIIKGWNKALPSQKGQTQFV